MSRSLKKESPGNNDNASDVNTELKQWPIQLKLINTNAAYLDNADLLIAADCTAFSYGNFHRDYMKNRITIIFCPKLDKDLDEYIDKLTQIFIHKKINSITIARMDVPCCSGVESIINQALKNSGKQIKHAAKIIKIG